MNLPPDPQLPPRLETDLRAAFQAPPVPANVDQAILSMARGVAAHRRNRRLLGVAAAATAAAAVAVMVWVIESRPHTQAGPGASKLAAAAPGDLNGDGRVDMLDALILEQRIERHQPGKDFNADGKTDKQDVDALALSAVKLERGSL